MHYLQPFMFISLFLLKVFKLRQRSFYNPKCWSVIRSVGWSVHGIFFSIVEIPKWAGTFYVSLTYHNFWRRRLCNPKHWLVGRLVGQLVCPWNIFQLVAWAYSTFALVWLWSPTDKRKSCSHLSLETEKGEIFRLRL